VIRSMTGFGSASLHSENVQAMVTIRSLNHRYLDITMHLARRLLPLEPAIKGLLQARLHRGRVDVAVDAVFTEDAGEAVEVCRPVVAGLVRRLREVGTEQGLSGDVTLSDIARFPGALKIVEALDVAEGTRAMVLQLVEQAANSLESMRTAEGQNLDQDLTGCLAKIEAAAGRIGALSQAGNAIRKQALLERVRELCRDLGFEDARIYQEVVRLVDRSDINEELQRLHSHVALASDLLHSGEPAGKRMDFIAQELMREANTIGSKAASAPLIQEVVALKTEIERFREQVQNIE